MSFAEPLPSTDQPADIASAPVPRADRVPMKRVILWSTHGLSTIALMFLIGYFTIYTTDTLRLNPAVFGALLVISNVIAGIGVILTGLVVDRAPETRWGKARPFELVLPACWVAGVLTFSVPGAIGDTGKYVWVFASYTLLTGLFMPLFDANNPLFTARVFPRRAQYSDITVKSGLMMLIFGIIVAVGMPSAVEAAGKDPAVWSLVAVCFAVPCTFIGLIRFWSFHESPDAMEVTAEGVRITDILRVLRTNPYIWAVSAIGLVASISSNIASGTYYFRYIVGNMALLGIVGISFVVMIPVVIFLPQLARRFSISTLIAASCIIGAAGMLGFAFAGANVPIIVAASALISFSTIPVTFLVPILIIDNATYNQWKGNRRLESIGGAMFSFARTLGIASGAGLLGVVLAMTGYDGGAAQQSDSANAGIIALTSYIPAAFALIAAALAIVYHKLEKKVKVIAQELEARQDEATAFAQPNEDATR